MWNVYNLIKSGAMSFPVWESPLDKTIRLTEERRQKVLTQVSQRIPRSLAALELDLKRLENCQDNKALRNIGDKIDCDSRDLAMDSSLLLASNIELTTAGVYEEAVSLISRAYEKLRQYPEAGLDLFADGAKMRLDYLRESAAGSNLSLARSK